MVQPILDDLNNLTVFFVASDAEYQLALLSLQTALATRQMAEDKLMSLMLRSGQRVIEYAGVTYRIVGNHLEADIITQIPPPSPTPPSPP